jgi:hypothetical protein
MRPFIKRSLIVYLVLFVIHVTTKAQTDIDAAMMAKNNFCVGGMYSHSNWKNYWEGTLKRENLNIGKYSSNMFAVMGNYGITDRLNVLFGLPFIKNNVSAGTLHSDEGIQDLSLWLKWMPVEKKTFLKICLFILHACRVCYSAEQLPGRLFTDRYWFAQYNCFRQVNG